MFACAVHGQPARRRAPHGRKRDLLFPGQVLACNAFRARLDILDRAAGDNLSAMDACPRAHIDNVVGGAHGFLVVLHHNHGIAQVPHALEGIDELDIVPLVQTDGRFVEHIEDAHERRTDLRGKTNALGLTARERGGTAGERQIPQAHVIKEVQSGLNLPEDRGGNHLIARGNLRRQRAEEVQ